jgi:hypothetical protein
VRYYATASSHRVREAMRAGLLALIATPAGGSPPAPGVAWCADNACYSGRYPGDERYLAWLARRQPHAGRCGFATAPDVVADAATTLVRAAPMLPRIRELGYPAALVAQDGLEHLPVPWGSFEVLFLGGTTGWKLSPAAAGLAARARTHGLAVHMGRVNSLRRLRHAAAIGATSADGTLLAYGPDRHLSTLLSWLDQVNHNQPPAPGRAGEPTPAVAATVAPGQQTPPMPSPRTRAATTPANRHGAAGGPAATATPERPGRP